MAEVSTVDVRIFIMLNGPLPDNKNTRKIFEVALIKNYGMSYLKNFKYILSNNIIN